MSHTQKPSLALGIGIAVFLVSCVVLTVPGQWNFWGDASSQTSVSLTVIASSASSSSVTSSSSSSSTSQESSQVSGEPSGHYRHHETRMAEIIMEIMRRRAEEDRVHTAPTNPPVWLQTIPFTWEDLFRNIHLGIPSPWLRFEEITEPMATTLPTSNIVHPAASVDAASTSGSASGSTASSSSTLGTVFSDSELKKIKDLDPTEYGWVSSKRDHQWKWEGLQQFFQSFGLDSATEEWVLWILFGSLLFIGMRKGLKIHDWFLFLVLPAKKRKGPRGGKAVAAK